MKIGIPRALLYYWYGFLWERFWKDSGFEVLTSPITSSQILMAGTEVALDEICLPVKIFLGHVQSLSPHVDYIMIPHLIKVESDAYICPKFMGLPDIVSHAIPKVKTKLLVVKVGPNQVDMLQSLKRASRKLSVNIPKTAMINRFSIDSNDNPGLTELRSYHITENWSKKHPNLTIGLLGHPYCLYDPCFNLDLLNILARNNIRFITPEMIPARFIGIGSGKLAKKLFWTTGRLQFDALEWMLHGLENQVDGFIQLTPFACGPEAIVGDMIERRVKEGQKPFLKIYFEEHSGEAGIITRLEAFLDLIRFHHPAC